jgi:hypothetical protein
MGATDFAMTLRAPETPQSNIFTLTYSGDQNTKPSSASLTQVVAPPTGATTWPAPAPRTIPPPARTTRRELNTMVDVLLRALKRRGLAALNATKQTISVASAGTLTQQAYAPRAQASVKAPSAATQKRRVSSRLVGEAVV